jgi:hypothetical protein
LTHPQQGQTVIHAQVVATTVEKAYRGIYAYIPLRQAFPHSVDRTLGLFLHILGLF